MLPAAIQVALSIVLLSAACLMLRTYWNLEHLNPGFDRAHIVGFTVNPVHVGYSPERTATFLRELLDRVAALPGVRSASYSSRGLMRGVGLKTTVYRQGAGAVPSEFWTSANSVSATFFETMGIPLLAGRHLEDSDASKQIRPVVINRAFADFLFPHQNPIGKFLLGDITKPPPWVVVGLAGNAKYRSLRESDPPIMYNLFRGDLLNRPATLYVRTFSDPAAIVETVRSTLRHLDTSVALVEAETLEQEIQSSLWQERLVTLLSAFFAATAAFLAATGIYGALAYSVARRTRELAIRIAVGAQARHVIQTVSARLARSVTLGISAGLLASVFLLRLMQHLLFMVSPLNLPSLTFAAAIVILLGFLAAAPSIRRALKTDPARSLRDQ
jgi:predicted permease